MPQNQKVLVNYYQKGNGIVFRWDDPVFTNDPICLADYQRQYKQPVVVNIRGMDTVFELDEYLVFIQQQKDAMKKQVKEGQKYVELAFAPDRIHLVESADGKDVQWFGVIKADTDITTLRLQDGQLVQVEEPKPEQKPVTAVKKEEK